VKDGEIRMDSDKLDINVATAEQLSAVPGIDYSLAAAIVAFRDAEGPFGEPRQLGIVPGVEWSTVDDIEDMIIAGPGPTRIDINTASTSWLMMIPGVSVRRARYEVEFIDARRWPVAIRAPFSATGASSWKVRASRVPGHSDV